MILIVPDNPRDDAADVTSSVLDAMLDEALSLTEEIAAVGGVRRAVEAPDSLECALRLRLAARLSRIAAWASLRGAPDPERLSIARAALASADGPSAAAFGFGAPAAARKGDVDAPREGCVEDGDGDLEVSLAEGLAATRRDHDMGAPLRRLSGQVDRLLERARRLDALLSGEVEAGALPGRAADACPPGPSAVILPFRSREASTGAADAEDGSTETGRDR